jgi:cellulose synthase/poly-beta-1,6-N-acetylglucosamine synthase-like glycosyltransferase
MTALLFYGAFALVVYTYIGYPLLIWVFGIISNRRWTKNPDFQPFVSLIIPAHNEAPVMRSKIENALALDYPPEKIEFLVASDDSSDDTVATAESFSSPLVRVLDYKERAGKMGTVVKAVREAKGEVLVMTDANALYSPAAIRELVAPLSDPSVGCSCGSKNILADASLTTERQEKRYWQYESFLKDAESRSGSCVGADGSIYAVRAALFPDPPTNRLVMDDFIVSLMIILKGYRCVFVKEARAFECSSPDSIMEFKRKARILAGALSIVQVIPRILVSSLSFKIISHKLFRWATGFFLLIALVTSGLLLGRPLFRFFFFCQVGFYCCAAAGMVLEKLKRPLPLLTQCYYFTLTALAQMWGIIVFLRTRNIAHWENLRNHAPQA